MSFILTGIGELLWDLLPGGRQLGGAPANFACHARALGAQARLVSRAGDDPLGDEALDRLKQLGVEFDGVEIDSALPTGTVGVELAADGQPRFQIHEKVAWDAIRGEPPGRLAVATADAVCFGSLAQRSEPSRSTIRSLVAAAPATALRIFDSNLRQHYFSKSVLEESMALANVLKVNDAEWPRLTEIFGLYGSDRLQIEDLVRRFGLHAVACTRGERGSLLYMDGRVSDHPGIRTTVVDTVGAGDAFTAAMTLGLLAGWDLDLVNERANRVAAFVCSQAGATPELPLELREMFLSAG